MKNFLKCAISAALTGVAFVSCNNARISGVIENASKDSIVIKKLNINIYDILDTVVAGKNGEFSYKVKINAGCPEFVYLFRKDVKLASLLLDRGDNVHVKADTLGHYSVDGSDECKKLQEVESMYADFMLKFSSTATRLVRLDEKSKEAAEVRKDLSSQYIDYYRDRLRYVLSNSHSLTVVPVFFQMINAGFPVFSQQTDALHFKSVSDSLKTVYPKSKYVKALADEAERRGKVMDFNYRLQNAGEVGFPDLEMSDVNGKKVKLSEVNGSLVMLHFWSSADARQKMFNQDILKPVYEDYHRSGFEIYAVCIDPDKAGWASAVRSQKLPWINVNDGLGTESSSLMLYNVTSLPMSYFIKDGKLLNVQVNDEASLRKLIRAQIKNR